MSLQGVWLLTLELFISQDILNMLSIFKLTQLKRVITNVLVFLP